MIWLFVALIAVAVTAVALGVVGVASSRLASQPPPVVLDLDSALEAVADMLSDEVTAELSFDDVRAVLGLHLDYLERKGIARFDDLAAPAAGPLIADEDEALAWVIGQVTEAGEPEVTDDQIAEILDAQRAYLTSIGAIEAVSGDAGRPGAQS